MCMCVSLYLRISLISGPIWFSFTIKSQVLGRFITILGEVITTIQKEIAPKTKLSHKFFNLIYCIQFPPPPVPLEASSGVTASVDDR